MKKFLLIVNEGYYPESGTNDWVGCFETEEEAKEEWEKIKKERLTAWFTITNLEEWMNK